MEYRVKKIKTKSGFFELLTGHVSYMPNSQYRRLTKSGKIMKGGDASASEP